MLQDGRILKTKNTYFKENTVVRLTPELLKNDTKKMYLGIMLFDLPADIQGIL